MLLLKKLSNPQALCSLEPAPRFPGLGLPAVSFWSGPLCLSQPVARGSAFTKWGAPLALARILLQSGHSLLSLPALPQVTPVLLDPAGPCAWQLAGPLSCPPVAALQTVPIACWFALIIFRPGSDACWRQSMWATKHPRTVRPSRVWTLLVNYLWTEETLEGKIPFVRRNQIYKNQAHSGCQLSDLCLCGLDIWDVWATADLRGHLFPQLHCQWWNSLERGVSCPWSHSSESRTKTWDPGPLSSGPVSSPPHSWQSDVLHWRAWWLKELEPALSYVLSFSIHWVVKISIFFLKNYFIEV